MEVDKVLVLLDKYGKCINCGCETIQGADGCFRVEEDYFYRYCKCGFQIKVDKNDKELPLEINNIDNKIQDGSENSDLTYRKFIKKKEKEYELDEVDLDSLNEIEYVDYLMALNALTE